MLGNLSGPNVPKNPSFNDLLNKAKIEKDKEDEIPNPVNFGANFIKPNLGKKEEEKQPQNSFSSEFQKMSFGGKPAEPAASLKKEASFMPDPQEDSSLDEVA